MNVKTAPPAGSHRAVEFLFDDHRRVEELFRQFENAQTPRARERAAAEALRRMASHVDLEEKVFYPAVKRTLGDDGLVDESLETHHVIKMLIAELRALGPGHERYEAKFRVFAAIVGHHIRADEGEIIPRAEKAGIDMMFLGEAMAEMRKGRNKTVTVPLWPAAGPRGIV